MIYKKVKCYEVEIKMLVRNTAPKKEIKDEIENELSGMSYTIEHLKINIK